MATNEDVDNEFPPSPEHFSGDENYSGEESGEEDAEEPEEPKPKLLDNNDTVSKLLSRLQSSGAIVKKPIPTPVVVKIKKEYRCFKCELDFPDWDSLEDHLIPHVSLPSVVLDRLPSEDESEPDHEPGDEDWSDEEQEAPEVKPKLDVSELLKYKNISLKKVESPVKPSDALSKLQGLGVLKKSDTPIKEEKEEEKGDLMKKLGSLGGLKLKLQTTSQGNTNSFKIVNGLRDFNTDDGDDDDDKEDDSEPNLSEEEEQESDGTEKIKATNESTPQKVVPSGENNTVKPSSRVKVTNVLRIIPPQAKQLNDKPAQNNQNETMTDVTIKNEPVDELSSTNNQSLPMDSHVKSECPTPPINDTPSVVPVTAPSVPPIKAENQTDYPDTASGISITEITDHPTVEPKKEKNDPVAVIEINGDSNDEDDDCCVVSATPAPDIKPKIENVTYPTSVSMPYPTQTAPTGASLLSSRLAAPSSTEKQHNFNWNAPDTKSELLEKSADAIFESLLASSNHKKESNVSEVNEYISLDNLHTCEVCQTRFTDTTMLENHRRATGHSKSLVAPTPSALLPSYSSSNSLLSSLFPVKQLADQVGRLSSGSAGGPFTHQQNMIINIQAYPPGQGMQQQPYNPYSSQSQQMGATFPGNNMYRMPGTPTAGQGYPASYSAGQYSPQSYPGATAAYGGTQPAYSQASPLQGMQQQVYGQSMHGQTVPGQMMPGQMQPGQMAPGQINAGQINAGQMGSQSTLNQMNSGQMPGGQMTPGQMNSPQQFAPASSPNSMKPPPPPGNIRIQNVQSFNAGQSPGAPMQVRGAGSPRGGIRPRMPGPNIRPGMRPSIRPGVSAQGRGGKLGARMPMKRPGAPMQGPAQKKKLDMLLPGKHDNEDCTVMSMQKQRDGLPMIHSVQGSKDNFGLGSGISITKKTVNKEASGMASLLASRGIMVKQKAKSRSPSPERPIPHIPNLGAGVSIKHTSKNSQFTIPEAKVGGSMNSCRICKKMFMNSASLSVHMSTVHPGSKLPMYKCEECPAGYPKLAQLQHHKRVFHNVSGPDRELGLPVVDLSQEETLKKLSDLGIYSFIPLANREQASGCFGIPVISVHNMNNGMVRGLTALGADGLLSLGPLKPLPNT